MKHDIQNKEDLALLVNIFYDKVKVNEKIGFIFNDVAQVNWDTHLPKIQAFWASMLFGENSFSGNPMTTHIELSKLTSMTEIEFAEWLRLFNETVNELFVGVNADDIKFRAANIARLMLHKIQTVS